MDEVPERLTADEFISELKNAREWQLSTEKHETGIDEPFLYTFNYVKVKVSLGPDPVATSETEYGAFIQRLGHLILILSDGITVDGDFHGHSYSTRLSL